MDKYCFYCGEAVFETHRVHELRNTFCCDTDKCQRKLDQQIQAAAEAAEYNTRDRYR